MGFNRVILVAFVAAGMAGLVSSYALNKADSKKVVCYFGSWATYRPGDGKYDVENIDPMICTHLMFGFAGLGADNKIYALDAYNELEENWGKGAYKRFTKLKQRNPNLKTLLAIGGWNEGSEKYSNMAATAAGRRTFIDSVVPFLQHENFDGLDLDWEYPADRGGKPEDKANFVLLCQELRAEFNNHGYLLTAAVSAGEYTIANAYDIPSISQSLDFINVMAYDFRGAWDHHPYTGHHAGFDVNEMDSGNDTKLNVKYAMEYWRNNGGDPNKLIVGLPTYGRGFVLSDPSNTGFYSPSNLGIPAGPFTRESGYWGYNEICDELSKGGWTTVKHPGVVGPYSYKNNWWIGYDDVEAIEFKSQWILDEGYGGAMFWSVETDDFHGKCGESNILIKAAYRKLVGEVQPEPTTTTTTPDPTAPTTSTTTTQSPPTPPPDGSCHYSGEFLGELCDPSFTICNWNGNTWDYITHSCNPPLYYDPNIKQCNWGDVIGCSKH